jgi:hypothetical protein
MISITLGYGGTDFGRISCGELLQRWNGSPFGIRYKEDREPHRDQIAEYDPNPANDKRLIKLHDWLRIVVPNCTPVAARGRAVKSTAVSRDGPIPSAARPEPSRQRRCLNERFRH